MKLLRYIFYLILAIALLFALFVICATLSDFRPAAEIHLDENPGAPVIEGTVFNLLIWNIGYCGLGDDMDFFYDGGEGVRSGHIRVKENLAGVLEFTVSLDSVDFLLFQEVIELLSGLVQVLPAPSAPDFFPFFGVIHFFQHCPVPFGLFIWETRGAEETPPICETDVIAKFH